MATSLCMESYRPDHTALLATLANMNAQVTSMREMEQPKLSELRRQAKAGLRRRGGAGSIDAHKYAVGASVMLLTGPVDATTLLGLFAQTDMMLKWMAEVRLQRGHLAFGELVAAVLSDKRKADWCRKWGCILEWANRKAMYDASVTSFIESGRTGKHEGWRRDSMTDDQAYLVTVLCGLLNEPEPALANKGEAFEWIYERGGNPEYWNSPEHPGTWSERWK